MVEYVTALHEKYGTVVRIHPDELSFIGPTAMHDIFGIKPELERPVVGTLKYPNGQPPLPTIVNTGDLARQRRILSHAFSERALADYEGTLQKYSNKLVECLTIRVDKAGGNAEVDLSDWYYSCTFDTIGEVGFSEELRSLELERTHPWIASVFRGIKVGKMMTAFDHFPMIGTILRWLEPTSIRDTMYRNFAWVQERVERRLEESGERNDFLKFVMENNDRGECQGTRLIRRC